MRVIVKLPKPRNPFALAARQRNAGSHEHRQDRRNQRRNANRELRNWLSGSSTGGKGGKSGDFD